jgi:hypothetical protein
MIVRVNLYTGQYNKLDKLKLARYALQLPNSSGIPQVLNWRSPMIVQDVSVSKIGLQHGGSEERTRLVSNKSPKD